MRLAAQDFIGSWRITREITDFRSLESGTLEGQAVFTATDDGLHYHERGTLTFAAGPPLLAERRYLWSFGDKDVSVAYADGAPFHSFALSGGSEASLHICGDDTYKGTYSFVRFPHWQVTWSVEGPRKRYRSVTRYTRD